MSRIPLWMVGFGLLALSAPASAHEKWFYDPSLYPTRWEELLRPHSLIAIALALALTGLAWVWWRARGGRDLIPGPEAFGAQEAGRADSTRWFRSSSASTSGFPSSFSA